jgi:hypothetical protein
MPVDYMGLNVLKWSADVGVFLKMKHPKKLVDIRLNATNLVNNMGFVVN